jgi:CubicO group peptidase (beta-lactamase class C family)
MSRALRYLLSLACLLPLAGQPAISRAVEGGAEAGTGPVASIRVDFDTRGLTRVAASGPADRRTGRALTENDPVRIASISKLVVALGVMRLVEQGTLSLDEDVSRYLGWRLRHPSFPEVPITLRLLLSHRSGLTDAAGYVASLDTRTQDQVAAPLAWDAAHAPGTYFRYTNLNFPVIAAAMERATGERFDRLMQGRVLTPLGLSACFNWASCGEERIARAVVLYEADGRVVNDDLQGRRPPCPVLPAKDGRCALDGVTPGENGGLFSPQGGLRISAAELARIGRLLLNGGELDGERFLTRESIAEMIRPQWVYDGHNGETYESDTGNPGSAFFCRYGLAVQTLASRFEDCRDDPFGDGRPRIGHAGDAYGLVSGLWLDSEDGTGVVYLVTGNDPARRGSRSAFYAAEEALLAR